MARDRSGRKGRIAHDQQVADAETSRIVGAAVFFGFFARGLADATHDYSWVALAVLLVAGWVGEAQARNRVVFAWNRRVVADRAIGISGAPTPAACLDANIGERHAVGTAVPIYTGGFHFFAESGGSHQFPPVEIVKIDRSFPHHRIQITTASTIWKTIVVDPQSWNVKAWELLTDRETYEADQ